MLPRGASSAATAVIVGIMSLQMLPARGKPRAEDTLFINNPLEWQRLDMGQSKLYGMSGLKANSMYEVKVSYPGTVPASVQLELVAASSASSASSSASRRLLDTEKLIFSTPTDAASFCSASLVRVTATWNDHQPPLAFNIVVAPLLLGVPIEVLPHAAVVCVLVICVLVATFREKPLWPASALLQSFSRPGKTRAR